MTAADLTLSAHDLSRRYGATTAVAGIDIELHRGEVLGLLGPNGAGKTTTMQMLTGNLAPSTGSVSVCGIDLLERPTAAKARIGYLPDHPPLYRELRVDEYLRLAARLHRVPRNEVEQAVAHAKHRCGIANVGQQLIGALSGGYQQRVGIAQAVVHRPDVVILDEPTARLDPNQIREIRTLIEELSDQHSVILSSHILPEVEAVCDRVQILHRGRIVYNDNIGALRRFRGGHSVLVAFRRAPAPEEIARLPGVTAVEPVAEGRLRVLSDEGADPTEDLVRASVERDWGLSHLALERASLEDVFVHLTRQEPAPPTGQSASSPRVAPAPELAASSPPAAPAGPASSAEATA